MRCPECDAQNQPGNKFCDQCGVYLTASTAVSGDGEREGDQRHAPAVTAPGPRARRKRRGRTAPDQVERAAINRQLVKARNLIKSIRALYVVLAILSGLGTTLLLMGAAAAAARAPEGTAFVIVFSIVATALLIGGAAFLHVQPFLWTLALAGLFTLNVALSLLDGTIPWIAGFIALGLWCAVPLMANVTRLMKEHPGLVDSSKLKQREQRDVDVSAARARAARRGAADSRKSLRTFAIVASLFVVIAIGGWFALQAASKLPDIEPQVAAFERAWRASDVPAVRAMFSDYRQQTLWSKIERLLQRRGWSDELPEIGLPQVGEPYPRDGETMTQVTFTLQPKGTLEVRWVCGREQWEIDFMVFSHTRD